MMMLMMVLSLLAAHTLNEKNLRNADCVCWRFCLFTSWFSVRAYHGNRGYLEEFRSKGQNDTVGDDTGT
jgi:hypothetical protein